MPSATSGAFVYIPPEMKFKAKHAGEGLGPLPQSFYIEAEVLVMLQTFENELDAILILLDSEPRSNVTEAIYRRYLTINDLFKDLQNRYDKISLKLDMVSSRVLGGFDAGNLLESTREPDTETT